MKRCPLKCRKGLGVAIASMFFIIIMVGALATIWAMSRYETEYQNVRQRMTEWDVGRVSENLEVRSLEMPSRTPNYIFDLVIDNVGGVVISIARLYVYNQTAKTLTIYDPQKGNGSGFAKGVVNVGEVNHVVVVKGTALNTDHIYRIIIATDRGREFSYIYPPWYWMGGAGGGGGGYELVMVSIHANFQYISTIPPREYTSAYIKPISRSQDKPIYRILLNNTTNQRIHFHSNCTMLQLSAPGGNQEVVRYVVSNLTTIQDNQPIRFTDQVINPHAWQYLYFAGSTNGTYVNPTWVDDPTGNDKYYLVGFLLIFTFEGETLTRSISIPVVIQNLTK